MVELKNGDRVEDARGKRGTVVRAWRGDNDVWVIEVMFDYGIIVTGAQINMNGIRHLKNGVEIMLELV